MRAILRYRWQYVDELSGRLVKTRHHASPEDFLKVHPEAKPIPGSEHVLELPEDPLSRTSAGHVQRGFGDR